MSLIALLLQIQLLNEIIIIISLTDRVRHIYNPNLQITTILQLQLQIQDGFSYPQSKHHVKQDHCGQLSLR